jgi:CDP-diglyceride synthetase
MCCFLTALVFLGPRVAAVIWWILEPARWVGETAVSAFDTAIWPILGIIFLPWTTLMYVIVSPGGVEGFWNWLFLILAILVDIGAYTGGGIGNRDKIPGM